MKREDQRSNAMDGVAEDDVPIDLTKKSHLEPSEPAHHNDISENKQPSPEWQVSPFYPPLFFLGGESTFRTYPAVAMANPFLLPYYPVLYEQLGLRYAMMRANPAFDNVNCLYRAASDTYLKDHVLQNRTGCGTRYGNRAYKIPERAFEWAQIDDRQSEVDTVENVLRKCKSLGTLTEGVQEETPCVRSLSCPDLRLRETTDQRELNGPRDKRMKMDLSQPSGKPHTENKIKFRRQDKFDLSAESRSRSMPSVSQGDQESFLQKLRHVAPAGFPCNVYGYYTHLMQKYQDHEELKRRVGIIPETSPPSSPGPEAKKRPTRTLTGKHVRHGTGASPSTLLTLRQMIQERQRAKEISQNYGMGNKCKLTRKHSNKTGRRST